MREENVKINIKEELGYLSDGHPQEKKCNENNLDKACRRASEAMGAKA